MEMTRGEVQDLLAKFSSESATYRDRVKSDAKDVISKQFGYEVPAGINVKVVEETADTVYLVLPHTVAEGDELSDSDLEAVAGGGSKIGTADCSDSDGMLNTANNFEMSLV